MNKADKQAIDNIYAQSIMTMRRRDPLLTKIFQGKATKMELVRAALKDLLRMKRK
jgi:hypothetical protein